MVALQTCLGSAISNKREHKSCLGRVFNIKLGSFVSKAMYLHSVHTATFRVENSACTYHYMLTNLDSVIDITSTLHSLLLLLIKALAFLFIRLYQSKASQASLLGLNYF
jgi:hypothetical protein